MIKLCDNYVVKVTPYSYNLMLDTGKDSVKIDKKTGEEKVERIYEAISYHGSLSQAVRAAMHDMQKQKLMGAACSLEDAIRLMGEIHDKFEKVLKEAIGAKEEINDD